MPLSPLSAYAVSKLAAENYCGVFHQIYHLPTICLRYFNVYGPRQDPNSQYAAVVPRFISLVRQGKPPIIYGDGRQTRDFTFVMDAVQANIAAAESQSTGIFNIGTGKYTTINELAQTVIRTMGKKMEPVYQEPRTGDIVDSVADISKAMSIGYVPRYSLAEGLKQTIDWFERSGEGILMK